MMKLPSSASSVYTVSSGPESARSRPSAPSPDTSAPTVCPPSNAISIRTRPLFSAIAHNHLRQDAVQGIGVDERDRPAVEPGMRSRFDHGSALGVDPFEGTGKVVDLEGDVVHPGASLGE